ncbi:acyl-[acyl-carrier-protein] thioesterase [Alkalibacter mobilis]|uniref:acyl-[acyl-carrier-protein] thioesterase n=1 Tax=Alkalibacter mobilis TaxID=2787712 RepID=UPI00189FF2C4|nr:acyl-ACP thioesterase domain-containing protein [Alkalibacter mobilis]MBF7096696.1 hypothetical protein [Alkalibacter mobilis]
MAGYKMTGEYKVHSYEVDKKQILKPEKLVNYAQDIAMLQGEELGLGQCHLKEKGLAWVITKFDISIKRLPKFNETLKLTTMPVGFHRLVADRIFAFEDDEKKEIARIHSQWVMIDTLKGRIKKIDDFYPNAYGFDFNQNLKLDYEKFDVNKEWDHTVTEKVKYGDIDFNAHVNNGRYIGWIMDSLPEYTRDKFGIENISIHYKKEALEGDLVHISGTDPRDGCEESIHRIHTREGDSIVEAKIRWRKLSE